MRSAKIFLRVLAAIFALTAWANAQQTLDIFVPNGNLSPYLVISRNLTWGIGGTGGVNNNFIFRTYTADEAVCVYVTNNNTTSSHAFTLTVAQTGDPQNQTFIGNGQKWQTISAPTFQQPQTLAASTTSAFYYRATGSANVVVSFTGSTTQAGSPETAQLFVVQTTQGCGNNGNQVAATGVFQQNANVTLANQIPVLVGGVGAPGITSSAAVAHIGTNGFGWLIDGGVCCQSWASGFISPGNISSTTFSNAKAAFSSSQESEMIIDVIPIASVGNKGWAAGFTRNNFLEAATDQQYLTQSNLPAFQVLGRFVNPPAGTTILHQFNKNNSVVNPAYKDAVISCSAACEVFVNRTSALGGTCTALTIQNMQLGNGGTVLAANVNDVAENNCTVTPPTVTYQMYDIQLPGGFTYTLDLSGFVNFHNTTTGGGIDFVENTAVAAGNVAVTLRFMEQ